MKKSLRAIYVLESVESVAATLVGIFVPIYFLQLGHSLAEVFIYYLVYSLVVMVFFFIAGFLSARIGLKKTFLIRYFFYFPLLVLLAGQDVWPININFLAVLAGISSAFYYFPFHVLFARSSQSKLLGRDVGRLQSLPQFFGIFGSLIGAAVAFYFGTEYLFLIAMAIYIASPVSLMLADDLKIGVNFDYKLVGKFFKKYPRYFWAEFFENIGEEVDGIIWPLFVFLSLNSILAAGLVGTLVSLGGAVFSYLVGKQVDKVNRRRVLRLGAVFTALLWFSRAIISSPIYFYISSLVAGFPLTLVSVPFNSIIYAQAKKEDVEEFIVFRETPIVLARLVVYALGILLVANIKLAFVIAGVSYLWLLFF